MKRNRLFILGIVTVLVALLSLTLVSGTFAKYTSSSATASDSARVAKWDVKVNNATLGNTTVLFSDLFAQQYAKDDDTYTAEANTVSASEKVIAPGTKGDFSFTVKNESEVSVRLTFTGEEVKTDNNIPIVYTLEKTGEASPLVDKGAFADVLTALQSDAATLPIGQASAYEYTVTWEWAFEATGTGEPAAQDAKDTTLGLAHTATVTVSIALTATQID